MPDRELPDSAPAPVPTFTDFGDLDRPRGIVLVLHGGQQHNTEPVTSRHASWWRMRPLARRVALAGREHGVAVRLLRYRLRGWNAGARREPDPVTDARWALGRLRAEHPGVPVVLLGHSMGGRTAVAVSAEPDVLGVVALAPWLPAGEPDPVPVDRPLLVQHGSRDRWTSPAASRAFVEALRARGGRAAWFGLSGAGHFMLSQVPAWNSFAADASLGLLGARPLPPRLADGLEQAGHR